MDKKLDHVALTISLQGIRMVDCATGDTHLEFSIYRLISKTLQKKIKMLTSVRWLVVTHPQVA